MKRTIEFTSLEDLKARIPLLEGYYKYLRDKTSEELNLQNIHHNFYGDYSVIIDTSNIPSGMRLEDISPSKKDDLQAIHNIFKVTVLE